MVMPLISTIGGASVSAGMTSLHSLVVRALLRRGDARHPAEQCSFGCDGSRSDQYGRASMTSAACSGVNDWSST